MQRGVRQPNWTVLCGLCACCGHCELSPSSPSYASSSCSSSSPSLCSPTSSGTAPPLRLGAVLPSPSLRLHVHAAAAASAAAAMSGSSMILVGCIVLVQAETRRTTQKQQPRHHVVQRQWCWVYSSRHVPELCLVGCVMMRLLLLGPLAGSAASSSSSSASSASRHPPILPFSSSLPLFLPSSLALYLSTSLSAFLFFSQLGLYAQTPVPPFLPAFCDHHWRDIPAGLRPCA
eukprot:3386722-Rhodomonas_salina.3